MVVYVDETASENSFDKGEIYRTLLSELDGAGIEVLSLGEQPKSTSYPTPQLMLFIDVVTPSERIEQLSEFTDDDTSEEMERKVRSEGYQFDASLNLREEATLLRNPDARTQVKTHDLRFLHHVEKSKIPEQDVYVQYMIDDFISSYEFDNSD